MASQDRKWFANRGQMLQVGIMPWRWLSPARTLERDDGDVGSSLWSTAFYALVGLVSFLWYL